MPTRILVLGAALCLVVAAVLLAIAGALDAPILAIAGVVFVLGAGVLYETWHWRESGEVWTIVTVGSIALAGAVFVLALVVNR